MLPCISVLCPASGFGVAYVCLVRVMCVDEYVCHVYVYIYVYMRERMCVSVVSVCGVSAPLPRANSPPEPIAANNDLFSSHKEIAYFQNYILKIKQFLSF